MRNLIIPLLVISLMSARAQQCHCDSIRDFQAMNRLARAMIGHPWDTTETLGNWQGVVLNELGCVQSLSVANLFMQGVIPLNSLGKLQCIQVINLASNRINGPIPPDLDSLPVLESLYLTGNQFSTQIPPELGSMKSLRYLRLDHNLLSGPIPVELGNLEKLTELFLGQNHLEGKIPDSFENLRELSALGLADNELSGKLPSFIQELPLISLVINNNNFQDTAWVNVPPNFRGANINISNNEFRFLPLLTTTGIREEKFMVQENRFTFDDLLPNYHFFSNIQVFGGIDPERYSPQKSFNNDTILQFSIFENPVIDLGIDPDIENNQYRWYKDDQFIFLGNKPQIDLNTIFNNASQYEGTYHCEVTNEDVHALTLTSGKYTVLLDVSQLNDLGKPEAFTPNGDGINDYFVLPDLFTKSALPTELIVYNRQGQMVFCQKEYDNQWDGMDFQHQPLPSGTYYYLLKSLDRKESGMVTILRNP